METSVLSPGAGSAWPRRPVLRLAGEGAQVAASDPDIDAGGIADFWLLDVPSQARIRQTLKGVCDRWSRTDVLVNNAGMNKPPSQATLAEWQTVMEVNAKGAFFFTKHVVPHMRANGGGQLTDRRSEMLTGVLNGVFRLIHVNQAAASWLYSLVDNPNGRGG